ncbi:hypothetical protein BDW62DRAFT_212903 [Aspergillus aurantiobrunneus]
MVEQADKRSTVLPEPGKRNILITSALPYVNNVPHLGNLIGSVLSADVFARYCRGCTDEYGTTSETRALVEKCTPHFDIFGRTTSQLQTEITHDIFLKLHQNGFLKEETTTQLYCQQHNSFLADRFVKGECPFCGYPDAYGINVDGATPITRDTKHIFLELDKLQPEIEQFFQGSAVQGAWSNNGKDIISASLKEGLKARSITRDMKWGTSVPLPGYEDKVIYAWFDACIDDVQLYQFLGKDNVAYYTVIFRGSQIGTRDTWTKLHRLSTTDFLRYEGGKFPKSRGIGVFGDSAQKTGASSDVWRDTEFNWDSFISNFVSRVVKFIDSKNFNNVVPEYQQYHEASFDQRKTQINGLLTDALSTVLSISQQGNVFLQFHSHDNKLAEKEPLKCAAVIGLAVNLIHLLASIISPFMPDTAKSINTQLSAYLFKNIKPEKGQEWRELFGGQEVQKAKEEEASRKAAKKAVMKERKFSRRD